MNRSKAAWPDAFRQGRDYGAGADFSAVAEATCLIQSRRVKPVRPFDHETASSTPGHDTVQHAGMGNATGFALAHVMGQDRYSSPRAADEICDRNRYLDLLLQLKPTAAQEELSTWHGRIAARSALLMAAWASNESKHSRQADSQRRWWASFRNST